MTVADVDPLHPDRIALTGDSLTIAEVVEVARNHAPLALIGTGARTEVEDRIEASAGWVQGIMDELSREREQGSSLPAYYGINTGFGHLAGRAAFNDPQDAALLMRNLIMSHSAGVGDYFEQDVVRAAMLIRANTLTKGYSGVRIEIINTLIRMLNKGVYPAVPRKGSVGSSGDLAPLSHLALVISRPPAGPDKESESGEAFVRSGDRWTLVSGKEAMARAGIERVVLGAKEGLALNNGATFSAAMAALAVFDAENLVENAEIALAMTHEALQGFRDPFLAQVHRVRPHPGQGITAERVLKLVEGSELVDSDFDRDPCESKCPPQDSYSQRCAPQVIGAVRDTIRHVRRVVETELNAATDNPLVFPDLPRDYKPVSCGNFHGEPLAFVMDFLSIALTELGSVAERRIFRLMDAPRCPGEEEQDAYVLPSCLVRDAPDKEGLNSGFLLAQYTAAALVSDCKTLAHPDSVDSIPTSVNKEDHVSMSTNAARHAREIVENIQHVVAIEMLCAAQALDFRLAGGRKIEIGAGTRQAYEYIRKVIDHLSRDRVLYYDLRNMVDLVQRGKVVEATWAGLGGSEQGRLLAEIKAAQADIQALEARQRQCEERLRQLG